MVRYFSRFLWHAGAMGASLAQVLILMSWHAAVAFASILGGILAVAVMENVFGSTREAGIVAVAQAAAFVAGLVWLKSALFDGRHNGPPRFSPQICLIGIGALAGHLQFAYATDWRFYGIIALIVAFAVAVAIHANLELSELGAPLSGWGTFFFAVFCALPALVVAAAVPSIVEHTDGWLYDFIVQIGTLAPGSLLFASFILACVACEYVSRSADEADAWRRTAKAELRTHAEIAMTKSLEGISLSHRLDANLDDFLFGQPPAETVAAKNPTQVRIVYENAAPAIAARTRPSEDAFERHRLDFEQKYASGRVPF